MCCSLLSWWREGDELRGRSFGGGLGAGLLGWVGAWWEVMVIGIWIR